MCVSVEREKEKEREGERDKEREREGGGGTVLESNDVTVMSMPLIVNCTHCLPAGSVNTSLRENTEEDRLLGKACSTHSMVVTKEETEAGMMSIYKSTLVFFVCFTLVSYKILDVWYSQFFDIWKCFSTNL